jgi:hypothetical protein
VLRASEGEERGRTAQLLLERRFADLAIGRTPPLLLGLELAARILELGLGRLSRPLVAGRLALPRVLELALVLLVRAHERRALVRMLLGEFVHRALHLVQVGLFVLQRRAP